MFDMKVRTIPPPPKFTPLTPALREQAKAKKKEWQKLVDEGITSDQAPGMYVAFVEDLKEKHGYDENKVPEPVGGS